MDALQAVATATQIISSMVGAVSALEQATRDLSEAPKKIRVLEEFVSDLENLAHSVKLKHSHKLHNPQLDRQIQSLNRLIERLHPNLAKARKVVSKNKTKNMAKVVWGSMVGDPLSKLIQLMRYDLNWWLEMQSLSGSVERVILSTAESLPPMLKVNAEQGYPVIKKCDHVRMLLEQEGSNQVILIVGLSGMGKSCLARQVASDPPSRFVHGAVELGFGQWCSRSACNGGRAEYHKRLTKKICRFLVQIGFIEKVAKEMTTMDLDDVCCLLQTALVAKSILILLDDVWEQDIVERFARLYDNDCRYLVTTRNEAVYEITEAERVEICKEDIKEISKEILLYHSMLGDEELLDEIVRKIEERISAWTFLPKENGEDINILHYGTNESYQPHLDYNQDKSKTKNGGHRVATILMYLSNVIHGGETIFPLSELHDTQYKDDTWSNCAMTGYAVKPVKGDALLVFNLYPNATPDESSIHGGCKVLEGEKWIATKRIHARAYSSSKSPPSDSDDECTDEDNNCANWAATGECQRNPVYMLGTPDYYGTCRKSCGAC